MSRKIELVLEVDDKGSAVVKNFSSTTEDKVKKMSDKSSGWIGKIEDRFKKVGGAAASVGVKFGNLIKKVGQLTIKLGAAAAAAIGFIAALTIKKALSEYTQFESALTNMVKVTNEPLSTIQAKIMKLPSALGSATEMVKGYYAVISAGVTEPAKAMETLKTSAMAAKGSGTDLFVTIEGLTKMMAGYEGKIKNVTQASDILFAMEKEGQTTFAQLIPVIGGVSKVSSDLGIAAEEMAGSMALITQTAGSTSEAATQYRAVLMSLMKPTPALAEEIKDMGYDSAQAAIASLGLAGTLQKLKESTGGSAEKMGELFGRQEALIGVSALSAQGFETLKQKITAIEMATGGTDKAFNTWKGTLSALWETFKNTIGKQAILIGEKLAPHLKTVLERLEGWLEKMRDPITQEFAFWIEKIADWAAKFWPHARDAAKHLADWYMGSKDLVATKLEEFINKVVLYTGELVKHLPSLFTNLNKIMFIVGSLAESIEDVGIGIGWLAAKIVGLFETAWEKAKGFYDKTVGLLAGLKNLASKPISFVVDLLGSGSTTKPLSEKIDEMTDLVNQFGTDVTNLDPEIIVDATTARTAISDLTLDYENFTNTVENIIPSADIDTFYAENSIQYLDNELTNFKSNVEDLTPSLDIDISPAKMALNNLKTQYKETMAGLIANYAQMESIGAFDTMYGPSRQSSLQQIQTLESQWRIQQSTLGLQFGAYQSRQLGGTVPKTGLYLLHKSEKVIPAPQAARERRSGITNTFGDIHIHIPASAAPQRPEDYRRITRDYIIPELDNAGKRY